MQISKKKKINVNQYSRHQDTNNSWDLSFQAFWMHLRGKASKEAGHPNELFKQAKEVDKYRCCFGSF